MPFNVGQVKYMYCHGYLSGALRVLYCQVSRLPVWHRYKNVLAGYVGQVQYYHGYLSWVTYSTLLSWLPVRQRYRNVMASFVGQVQYSTVQVQCCKATCLGHVKYCHGRLCGAGTEMSRLPLSGAGTVLSWLPL
jgi:hypothetical protein